MRSTAIKRHWIVWITLFTNSTDNNLSGGYEHAKRKADARIIKCVANKAQPSVLCYTTKDAVDWSIDATDQRFS